MALQDLTPQLRTRLNRMERAVGWFILLAAALLLFGFCYYIYNTAESRGWFRLRARFYTYAESGQGFSVGDPVMLIGARAGQITSVLPMPPTWGRNTSNNVYIEFVILEPNFGYIWTEGSKVLLSQSSMLTPAKRDMNLTKGTGGYAIYITQPFRDDVTLAEARTLPDLETNRWRLGEEILEGTNLVAKAWQPLTPALLDKIAGLVGTGTLGVIDTSKKGKKLSAVWNDVRRRYEPYTKKTGPQYLPREELPALTDRLQGILGQVEAALPNFLQLTNQLYTVLSNSSSLTENLSAIAENARPMVTNLNVITTHIRNPKGSLGEWLIATNINQQLGVTLQSADSVLATANMNLMTLNRSLNNLGNITSNLNKQVQANSNILTRISDLVVHSDQFVQGMKRFWLFRHLFRHSKTNDPPANPAQPSPNHRQKGS